MSDETVKSERESAFTLYKSQWASANYIGLLVSVLALILVTVLIPTPDALLVVMPIFVCFQMMSAWNAFKYAKPLFRFPSLILSVKKHAIKVLCMQAVGILSIYLLVIVPVAKAYIISEIFTHFHMSARAWVEVYKTFNGATVSKLDLGQTLGRDSVKIIDKDSKVLVDDTFIFVIEGNENSLTVELKDDGLITCGLIKKSIDSYDSKIDCSLGKIVMVINK